jgi:putative ABC transport system permease protein
VRLIGFAVRGIARSRRTAVPLALLAALTTAAVTGAVIAGDCVRGTLSAIAAERLGRADFILDTPSRFISAGVAERMSRAVPGARVAAVVRVTGSASSDGLEVPRVQVVGVDAAFFSMAPNGASVPIDAPRPGSAFVNERAAELLSLRPGSAILVSTARADAMSLDAPLSGSDPGPIALSLTVEKVVSVGEWGRFSLRSEQRPPATVFVDREALARAIGRQGKANLILASGSVTAETLDRALAGSWDVREAGFSLRRAGGCTILESERVFIEPPAAALIDAARLGGAPVSGYFLDAVIAAGGAAGPRESPFVFAAGLEPALFRELFGTAPAEGEAVITDWLARDLRVRAGETVSLSFRVPADGAALAARAAEVRVSAVVPVPRNGYAASLMPSFPGMSGAASCTDWDPGIPLDLSRVREKDERYWETFGGTPKVYIARGDAARLWANAYGDRTAYFFSGGDAQGLARSLSETLSPSALGLAFSSAAAYGRAPRSGPMDFGALFLGLSLFLVASALLLTALVFSLHARSRDRENGLLLAVGFTPARVAAVLLVEGGLIAAAAALIGCALGAGYSLLLVRALNGPWAGAVAGGGIRFIVRPGSLALSAAVSLGVSLLVMAAVVARRVRVPPMALLGGVQRPEGRRRGSRGAGLRCAAATALAACAAVFAAAPGAAGSTAMGFFVSGAAALGALLALESALLAHMGRLRGAARAGAGAAGGAAALGLRNAAVRRGRNIAGSSLVACALFVILSVGANPWLVKPSSSGERSGTGGFSFFIQASRPFRPAEAAARLGEGYRVVAARLRDGDDASCLNLAPSLSPPILGVPPSSLEGRFSFAALAADVERDSPWSALGVPGPDGALNAFADSVSLEWSLGLKVGDVLEVRDEAGRPLRLRIAGALSPCVLQGSIVVSEDAFRAAFPSVSGHSVALVEAPRAPTGSAVPDVLRRAFRGYGAAIEASEARLESFARVEYAYLSIFLFLGATGLFFGMAGFAVIIRRNVREESSRRALMAAVGLGRARIFAVSFVEQACTLLAGVLIGALSSALALAGAGGFPAAAFALITACAACAGLAWSALASLPGRGDGGRELSAER